MLKYLGCICVLSHPVDFSKSTYLLSLLKLVLQKKAAVQLWPGSLRCGLNSSDVAMQAARQCRALRGVHALVKNSVPTGRVSMSSLNCGDECEQVLEQALSHAVSSGLCREAMPVIVLVEQETPDGRFIPSISLRVCTHFPRCSLRLN